MRIAQVAPLYESVPPKLYGGTERVVSHLTDELVRQGHEVTLFASGDSITSAELVPACPRALRLNRECRDSLVWHFAMLEMLAPRTSSFDIVHFHIDYLHFPLSRRLGIKRLTTLHGRLDIPDLRAIYDLAPDEPVISISDSQRAGLPHAHWIDTVYHGLPLDMLSLNDKPSGYLAFLGRISPEKGADEAIRIAVRAGMPLRIAAKVDRVDRDYFETTVRPLMDHPLVEFIGEINDRDKQEFLGNATAVLFPIDWPEPFGLVMIEAMACGTPVIAYDHGSVPEVIDDSVTGRIVRDLYSAVDAVKTIGRISRKACRNRFEERFSVSRMANDYVKVYKRIIQETESKKSVSLNVAYNHAANGRSDPAARTVLHSRD